MRAYLGLGANLGDPPAQLARAVAGLARHPQVRVTAVSSLYRTTPVGGRPQPDYWNAVAEVETGLSPQALLAAGLELERRAGRVRGGERNEPRVLDVDVLLYGEAVIDTDELQIPHPRLAERAFALVPLAEVAPQARHPRLDRTAAEMAAAAPPAGVEKIAERAKWLDLRPGRQE